MSARAVVFLGPSLASSAARRLCPEAEIRPPAAQGDLLGAVLDDGASVVGLVDGVFDQSPSVWHKEVLFALERGVVVLGAASMGALRAAELDRFGMCGVGRVYELFADGSVVDDDEVALSYCATDDGYVHTSEPMVNIRATLDAAVRAGVASARTAALATALLKGVHFSERSYPRLRYLLREAGLPTDEVERLAGFVRENAVDVKADDARLLLHRISAGELPAAPPPRVRRTLAFDTLLRRDRPLAGRGERVSVDAVAERFRRTAPDAPAGQRAALDRGALLMVGELLGVEPTEEDAGAELRGWRDAHHLDDPDGLAAWLERNRTSAEDLHRLAREEAVLTRLRRWAEGAQATQSTGPLLLDHLRWSDALAPYLAGWDQDGMDQEGMQP